MGFISFNENYYRKKLEAFENKIKNKILLKNDIYEVQQLLKVLDDLNDEGYTNLNDYMEKNFFCLTRLRSLLKKTGVSPIPIVHKEIPQVSYCTQEYKLNDLLDKLIIDAKKINNVSSDCFLKEIYSYSEWIGYEENTAYIFLLRDSLLPYIYYKSRLCKNIYPWLISRKFLEDVTKIKYIDDDIRLPIYEALESGYILFEDFFSFCKNRMLAVLDQHLELKQILLELLSSIKENKIIVIESGYTGTVPMMLKALDQRITFRLYTTAPFLYETYKNNIFCQRYEDIRKFETVYSQDLLLRYSSYRDRRFYINTAENDFVVNKSLEEIRFFIK